MNRPKNASRILLLSVFFVLAWAHCGTSGKKPAYPSAVDAPMKTAFNRAESDYYRKSYDAALAAYEKYLTDFPYNQLSDEARYKIGKIHFIRQRWEDAVGQFLALAGKSPDPVYRAKGNFMAGYTSFEANDLDRASSYLDRVQTERLPGSLQIHHYSLRLKIAEKTGNARQGADYAALRLLDAYQQSSDSSLEERGGKHALTRREVEARVKTWMTTPWEPSGIPSWAHSYPRGFARGYVDFKLGKTYFDAGNRAKAEKHLMAFVHDYPKNEYAGEARGMLEQLGADPDARPAQGRFKVGVLLPLSGPSAGYGETTLNGIKCAAGLSPGCSRELARFMQDKPEVELVIRDSGVDPQAVSGLIDALAREDVEAIIGPMSASLAETAAKRAQQIKLVLLPITQKSGLMSAGDYVFQMGYEVDRQVEDLVKESINNRFRSFGILYPNNNYGQEMASRFEEVVKASGASVVTKASYAPGGTELTAEARQLRLNINRYSFTDTSAGFEALFIPDSYAMVNRLIPVLQNVNVRGVALLGTNAWHDPNLTAEMPEHYPGSFFVDLFYKGGNDPLLQAFVRGYAAAHQRTPTSIEALGFDAVWFLRQAARHAGETKSGRLKEALLGMRNLEGVTGIRSFIEEGGPQVSPFILTPGATGIELAP